MQPFHWQISQYYYFFQYVREVSRKKTVLRTLFCVQLFFCTFHILSLFLTFCKNKIPYPGFYLYNHLLFNHRELLILFNQFFYINILYSTFSKRKNHHLDDFYLFFRITKLLLLSSIGNSNLFIFSIIYFLSNFLLTSSVNSLSISPFKATNLPFLLVKCIV